MLQSTRSLTRACSKVHDAGGRTVNVFLWHDQKAFAGGSEPLIRVVTSRELCHCVPDLIMLSSLFLAVSAAMCCNVQMLPADQNATS